MKRSILVLLTAALSAAGEVPFARLRQAGLEPGSWLTYSGTYSGQRYSSLSQIDTTNVARLRPVWIYQLQKAGVFEATPLVADGVMYIVEPPSTVTALDVRTGRRLWTWTPNLPKDVKAIGFPKTNRGVALLDDKVFVATLDAHLVALDAKTGVKRWETKVAASGISWWYARVGGTEYLSRCSRSLTREYIQAETEAYGRLRLLIPDTLLTLLDMPRVSLLLPLETQRAADDAVLREMLRVEEELVRRRLQGGGTERSVPAVSRLLFLPNLRLDDRDLSAVFTYLDERTFQAERLLAADDLLHYVLSRRAPMLPPWLIEGVVGIYRQTQLRRDQVAMRPLAWSSAEARAILQRDPSGPRTLLPPGELFSERVFRGSANQHAMRVATWRAQTALFVRWALDPQHAPAAAALWKFAEGAATQAVTEAWFRECFGFGYSDLRDRLSDYLPQALKEPLLLRPPAAPASVTFKLEPATREQVARLRGECERLEIPYVRRQAPQFLEHYIGQARRTLRRAYERGDRDPRLVAALGLCELDAGDPAAARPLLEAAAAAGVKRPRVHFERARLRWEAAIRAYILSESKKLAETPPPPAR